MHLPQCTVAHALDGDALTVRRMRVPLFGIDAPETG